MRTYVFSCYKFPNFDLRTWNITYTRYYWKQKPKLLRPLIWNVAVFHQVLKFNLARFKMRAFFAAYCLENRWYDRFEKFCRVQTWNWISISNFGPEMIIISHFSNVFRSTFFHVLKVFFENFHVFLCAFWEELKKRMCVLSGILNRTRQHWVWQLFRLTCNLL